MFAPYGLSFGQTLLPPVGPPLEREKKPAKAYFCQKCENHNHRHPRRNHKTECPFNSCTCEKCVMVDERCRLNAEIKSTLEADPLVEPLLDEEANAREAGPVERRPCCQRCRAHGEKHPLRNHKRHCKWKHCVCDKCKMVEERRRLMAKQIKLRREQKRDREKEQKEQNEQAQRQYLDALKANPYPFPGAFPNPFQLPHLLQGHHLPFIGQPHLFPHHVSFPNPAISLAGPQPSSFLTPATAAPSFPPLAPIGPFTPPHAPSQTAPASARPASMSRVFSDASTVRLGSPPPSLGSEAGGSSLERRPSGTSDAGSEGMSPSAASLSQSSTSSPSPSGASGPPRPPKEELKDAFLPPPTPNIDVVTVDTPAPKAQRFDSAGSSSTN